MILMNDEFERVIHDGVMINSWNVSCAVNTLTFELKTDVRMKK